MKLSFTLLGCIAALFAASAVRAQEWTGAAASQKIEGAVRIRMNAFGTAPDVVIFDPATALPIAELANLQQRLFGNRPEDSWSLIRSEDDQIGMTHARYQQRYNNLIVDGCVYLFHLKDGKIVSANGDFTPQIDLSTTAVLTSEQAIALAAAGMKTPLALELTEQTTAELVVLPLNGKPVLAYKCTLFSSRPLVNVLVYIDANNGDVLREVNRLCAADVPGTANTHFSGTRAITTNEVSPGNFVTSESGRGMVTYNTSTFDLYADDDNTWDNVNPTMDEFAGDVHFGVETTYDFFFNHFGRVSYDNNGGLIRSFVNDTWTGPNAYWSVAPDNAMHFGSGDTNYFPFASLEVTGHEFSHGVTEHSAGLAYYGESGALNESFSDIFGNTIRFLSAPDVATWYLGDQLLRPGGTGDSALRNMADPNEYESPDTYGGQYFNNGDIVHFNSGIQNYWYYLLTEGGSGTNDLGNAYSVNGIGLNDAMTIAYRNLAYYLTTNSNFLDAREGAEQAAIDLFGLCSEQHVQTVRAWYAVGVGPQETNMQLEATYENANSFTCAAPLSTQFFAGGTYAAYSWNFGDGTTSSLQNPTHTYANDGFYTVTLIVSNNTTCQDPDTLIVTNGVVIGAIDPVAGFTTAGPLTPVDPVAFTDTSLYGPTSWSWNFGDGGTSTVQHPSHLFADTGVYTVQLTVQNCHGTHTIIQQIHVLDYLLLCGTYSVDRPDGIITDAGGINGNYGSEQTCELMIRPCNASLITLTFEEFDLEDGYDWLTLMDDQYVMIGLFTGNTLPPVITTTTGTIFMSFTSNSGNELSGFKMRFTSELNGAAGPNTTQLSAVPGTSMPGQFVQFLDDSSRPTTYWLWDFGDGTTSITHQPDHIYSEPGIYTVTFTATYCDGYTSTQTMTYIVGNVGLEESPAGNLLTVAPNPFSQSFVIAPGTLIGNVRLRILDMSGREVYSQQAGQVQPEGLTIDPAALSSGQYLLEIAYSFNGAEAVERQRIQVQR